ncbi:MAG TPA: glycosyltransferase family 39 protein [Candidatus Binatia bacterium]|nr:glycosyltransferase family 39 protein [Candidatus Binatia bacterium]
MAARQGAVEAVAAVTARATAATPASAHVRAALGLAAAVGGLLAVHLELPAFYDNEGRYAEVARQILRTGDWITPRLDGTLFLNKPPLVYWLAAVVFHLAGGPTEWARLVPLAAAVATIVFTCRLGARLWGEGAGLLAGMLLATTLGFGLEARTLRPDAILVATVTGALLCWHHATTATGGRRTRWLVGLYALLAVGVLDKGLVPLVIAGLPIGALTLRARGWRGVARLRPGLGLLVLAAIVLPWHVAVALRHPGFAWDYVVNQHLLFFFDAKLPRDSEGDSLPFFWGALLFRAAPWILLVPLTAREALAGLGARAPREARASLLCWTWGGGLMLFFSLAPSRLEHYGLPALPAVALLAARGWERLRAGHVGRGVWLGLAAAGAAAAAAGAALLAVGARLLAGEYWIGETPGLGGLVEPAGLVLLGAGAATAVAALGRRAWGVLASLAVLGAAFTAIVLRAEVLAEPIFSWRPVARALADLPADTEVVFEAPQEYQIVGGLAYYADRPITLLAVPGFVPPTYLAGAVGTMFLARPAFERRWMSGAHVALVSDPQQRRDRPDGLVPGGFRVHARFGDRWVLTNFAAAH